MKSLNKKALLVKFPLKIPLKINGVSSKELKRGELLSFLHKQQKHILELDKWIEDTNKLFESKEYSTQ